MSEARPELTVIIPTHNRADLLARSLEALARQEGPPPFEVWVAADGCRDATIGMLETWQARLPLQWLSLPGVGAAGARNAAADQARGRVLLFLDDDCQPVSRCLLEHARDHCGGPAVVIGRLLADRKHGGPPWHRWHERQLEDHYRAMLAGLRATSGKELYAGNFSVDRQAFLDVGGFDAALPAAEDVDLGYRLEAHGVRFVFNPDAAAVHSGRHPLPAWRRRAYSFGRTDVLLAQRPYGHTLEAMERRYRRLHPALRLLAPATRLGGPASWVVRGAVWTAARTVSGLGLEKLGHWGYSAAFTLEYWAGVWDTKREQARHRSPAAAGATAEGGSQA